MSTNKKYLSDLKAIECPDSTFDAIVSPLVIQKAKDAYVWDIEDTKYLDFCAGFGSLPLGHNPDCLQKVWQSLLTNQSLIQGMGDVYPSAPKVELAKILLSLTPPHLKKLAFTVTGSQAVEFALKTAILKTGCSGFISFDMAYHGLDLGVLGLEGNGKFKQLFQRGIPTNSFTNLALHCDLTEVKGAIERLISSGKGFAGIVVEPIQGRGGVRAVDQLWLQNLKELCHENDGLLILDEIWTGMGRAGKGLLFSDIEADLVTIGKGLGCGMPISACLGTSDAMNAWPNCDNEALHTGTFFGHALSCQVALASLDFMAKNKVWCDVNSKGSDLHQCLSKKLDLRTIHEIRQFGLLVGIEFKEPLYAAKLFSQLRKNKLLALPSGKDARILSLSPPLNVKKNEILEAVHLIHKSMQELL